MTESIPTTMGYFEPDPRSRLFRTERLDFFRKPVAGFMVGGVAALGCYTLCERIAADTRGAANVPSLDAPAPVPIHLGAQALTAGGTVASGFYRAPPYDAIDPAPPEPIISIRQPRPPAAP